jgi:hypothetical protein
MPRKTPAAKPELGNPEIMDDRPLRPKVSALTFEERNTLSSILSNPVFVKAWRNAQLHKPSAFIPSVILNAEFGPQSGTHRLHEIRGWEMFQAALVKQIEEPKPKQEKPMENFPNEGTLEHETLKRMSTKPTPRQVPGVPVVVTPSSPSNPKS